MTGAGRRRPEGLVEQELDQGHVDFPDPGDREQGQARHGVGAQSSQTGGEVVERHVIVVFATVHGRAWRIDDRFRDRPSRANLGSQRHRRGQRHGPGTVGTCPPPGVAADGLRDRAVDRHGQGDRHGGLRPAHGQPACREAVAPHVQHDDGGDGRQNQPRDQAAPAAEPDQPRIDPVMKPKRSMKWRRLVVAGGSA